MLTVSGIVHSLYIVELNSFLDERGRTACHVDCMWTDRHLLNFATGFRTGPDPREAVYIRKEF